ncbi:MAG TPA: transposase [Gemmata sp.]
MNPPRVSADEYPQFLLGTPKVGSACEAARVHPHGPDGPAHDAFSRLLARLEPDAEALWQEVRERVRRPDGILIVGDAVLGKPYPRKMGLVGRFWSGKHKRVVQGINLVTLAWTDGDAVYPTDCRLVDPAEEPKKNKSEHFREMLATAKGRGFTPRYIGFDCWYSGRETLKAIRNHGWHFLTQVRSNRRVDIDRTGNKPICEQPIAATGTITHVEGFGFVQAFRLVATNGDTEHWITNDLGMDELARVTYAERSWAIEEHHRGLKQYTEVERCSARRTRSQRNHIGFALRAFVRLEWHRFRTGTSWFEAKWIIIRKAVRIYLSDPRYRLPGEATA